MYHVAHPDCIHLCDYRPSEDKKCIIDACAVMGTAESWQPLDLTDNHPWVHPTGCNTCSMAVS